MREFIAAAVQLAPSSAPLTADSMAANTERALELTRACHQATGAELLVLPESVTTGFTPGIDSEQLWDLVSELPGPALQPFADLAAELGAHLVVGTYERGPRRGVVYNAAAVVGPAGELLGVYRKTHPFTTERADRGGWVTPGEDVLVVDTDLGKIGVIICFDGDYPELSRITAIKGAEVICRPSALLRSADLWELTNRARAYDNHVYVIGTNATGVDPAGVIYFGNSMIVTPIAEVVARAASHECWVSARLDPATAMSSLTPGSSIPQSFDHLADRNMALIRKHSDVLLSDAGSSFPKGKPDVPRPRPVIGHNTPTPSSRLAD
ncbi:carbon-nitrogen hydrolase family protein [Jatrophihabitans lederbergiae]|uniref:Carbon-nitrogen hydrolase family protein n=1 Tax=Jatrophihabitans lederbergiae TaxID=3075547 RepID=A0ABU2J6B1_9ACTN|nr:carbon-nitrogen hydrolase family protein [Jatrophihabitans sp. DSM 44399]MDT0260029.1 carbon-nitrogen hydrolase family protein [Jatrophihabitans sp. DSM 44399]